jgi:uncharacterized protein
MKRLLLICGVVLVLSWTCVAQTSDDDSPATKADVERYFQVVRSHDMMKKMMAAMTPALHQVTHEQFLKHQDELPADYESKMITVMDTMFANMPMDQMMDAMVPVYQKYLTKGDIDNLVAFYSTPTGAKLLQEMPTIMGEAMQQMMPIMTKYMDNVKETLLKQTNDMIAQSKKPAGDKASAAQN